MTYAKLVARWEKCILSQWPKSVNKKLQVLPRIPLLIPSVVKLIFYVPWSCNTSSMASYMLFCSQLETISLSTICLMVQALWRRSLYMAATARFNRQCYQMNFDPSLSAHVNWKRYFNPHFLTTCWSPSSLLLYSQAAVFFDREYPSFCYLNSIFPIYVVCVESYENGIVKDSLSRGMHCGPRPKFHELTTKPQFIELLVVSPVKSLKTQSIHRDFSAVFPLFKEFDYQV